MRVKSGVNDYLLNKLNLLRSTLNQLRKYKSRASKGADNKGAGSWDNIYKRFTKQFINSEKGNPSSWEEPIEMYLDLAKIVYHNSADMHSVEGIKNNLKNMCSPRTGSPKGISIVFRLIEEFINTLTKILGSSPSLNKDGLGFNQNTSDPSYKGSSNRRVFEYEYTFRDLLEIDFLNIFTGYEFLGTSLVGAANMKNTWKTNPGIKQLSRSEYQARVSAEVKKYILPNVVDNTPQNTLEAAIVYHDPVSTGGGGLQEQRYFSDHINVYELATKYLTPSGVKFTGTVADLLEGSYTGFYQSEGAIRAISRTSVVSLIQHVVAGSYSTKFKGNLTFNQQVKTQYGTAVERELDTYLSILEKYNCHIVSSDSDEYNNYITAYKPSTDNVLSHTYDQQYDIFITDEDGNEILNPVYEGTSLGNAAHKQRTSDIKSSTGRRYDYIMGTKEEHMPNILSSVAVMKTNIFPNHLDRKEDYNLASDEARMTKILLDKGKEYVNNLPFPLWTMLLEQQPTAYGAGSALRRGIIGIENIQSRNFPFMWMMYKNIVSVEVLAGFEEDSRYVNHAGQKKKLHIKHIASPRWATLTPQIMDSLLNTGASQAICRLKRYYNDDFNIRETSLTTKIPILNQYFTIDLTDGAAFLSSAPVVGAGTGMGYGG